MDVLFRSLAENYGGDVLYVVLTGMGSDGLHGAEKLKAAGAMRNRAGRGHQRSLGNAGRVASAGLADCVLPLDRIPAELLRRAAG